MFENRALLFSFAYFASLPVRYFVCGGFHLRFRLAS